MESVGGKFIKWTGDGFLAWFETPLHRDLERTVSGCLDAMWHLTVIVNVTQLGLSPKRRFKIRHGITYEHDALLTKITHPGGFETLDLIGRSVVLAFRLSGVTADFPCITTQKEIVEAAGRTYAAAFRTWKPTAEESLRYFKGEKWGTKSLCVSIEKKPRISSKRVALKRAKSAIEKAEGQTTPDEPALTLAKALFEASTTGPEWSQGVATKYLDFLKDGLLKTLKTVVRDMERTPEQLKPN